MSKAAKKFDLGDLDTVAACNKPAEINIKHPVTGDPTDVFVSALGKDSDKYQAAINRLAEEGMRSRAMGVKDDDSAAGALKNNIDILSQITTGWRTGDAPIVTVNGEDYEFSTVNAAKLYGKLKFVREQVLGGIFNLANFFPA
jgi:hypothetical protein